MSKRTFKIVDVRKKDGCETKFKSGRYKSRTPGGAAKKAFNRLCRVKNIRGQCALNMEIAETTRGSNKKHFKYHLRRVLLKNPIKYKIEDNEITIRYKTTSKKIKLVPKKCKKSNKRE